MANLLEVAQLAYNQLYPNGTVQSPIQIEEFIAAAKNQFAYESLIAAYNEKNQEGYFNVPSYLLTEVELDIVDNEADISSLKILRSLPQEVWAVNIGGLTCQCKYIKSDVNLTQLLCDDDSLDDAVRTYLFLGKKIKFPKGVHKTPLPFIYANSGESVSGYIEVDGALAAIIKDKLVLQYGGKVGQEDITVNGNPNT